MPKAVADVLVFAVSAAVLVLEILAGRLLAPYVGVTLQTTAAVIGTVLAGIALGTWAGGRLADRLEPRRLLGPIVVAGGALAIASVPVVRGLGSASASGVARGDLSLFLTGAGFLLPAAVLSAVNPVVVKLQLRDLDRTGEVVGRLSALSTAGALLGTFATGFLLVATAPVRTIIVLTGALLVVTGAALWIWLSRADHALMGALTVAVVAAGLASAVAGGRCDVESAYFCARIEADPSRASGRVLHLDDLRHSYVDLEDPTHLEFRYTQGFADAIDSVAPAGPLDALHIGGGGFTMPRWLEATRPGSSSLVLELDPAVVDLARDRLGLVTGPGLEVREGDARLGLRRLAADGFDLVVGDAFGGRAVPWHLATRELVSEVERVLRPDGIYVLNVIDAAELRFLRAELATLGAVFEHVAAVAPASILEPRPSPGGNVVLVASERPLDLDALAAQVGRRGEEVVAGEALAELVGDAEVLTDDFAPVDQLLGAT